MSRPRYWWRPNVEKVIRNYPLLRERKADRQRKSVTASYSGMPRGGGTSRTTENVAFRQLSRREDEDFYAVETAIEDVGRSEFGGEILRVVEYKYWRGYNFAYVADVVHISENTAKRRADKFVYAVARNLGYI